MSATARHTLPCRFAGAMPESTPAIRRTLYWKPAQLADPRGVQLIEAAYPEASHELGDRWWGSGHQGVKTAVVAQGEVHVHAPASHLLQEVVLDPRSLRR